MGCSIAYQLAKQGIKSTLLERTRLAAGASGATAGVVGPLWHIEPGLNSAFSLGMRSLEMFPGLVEELLETGIDPGFRQNGILKLAFTLEQVEELKSRLSWQVELGATWLQPKDVFQQEPEVSRQILGGVFSPREGHIVGQLYVEALAQAARHLGAQFKEGTEVTGLEFQGRKVTGVRTAAETFTSEHTVLAAGPWTGISDRWLPEKLPVRPVKGQRILLKKAGFLPRCPVRGPDAYVVPQNDGNLLVAATREEGKFDEETTVDGINQMVSAAIFSFPVLKDAAFVGARAGVRPGSPDGVPIMGPIPGWEGLSIASGHDQAGVMLSPASGELLANYISSGDSRPLEPFNIARFRSAG